MIETAGAAGAPTHMNSAASLHAPAAVSVLYGRTRQYFVPLPSVFAGAVYVVSAPVTVASAVHVCISVEICSSALVWAVPV